MSELLKSTGPGRVIVDAHVHFRDCFDPDSFVESARTNMEDVACQFGSRGEFVGVICLATISHDRGFSRLLKVVGNGVGANTGWERNRTHESLSLCLVSKEGQILVVIAGRQLVTRGGLEVLAIGTTEQFEEGRPVETLIREVSQTGALPVVPWGVGKWVGARGRRVDQLLRDPDLPPFFLGDNGNRPDFWPRPSRFRTAEKEGIKNLPGSDPLPLPGEAQRVGSVGVVLEGGLDLERPADDLKRKLQDSSTSQRRFGSGVTPLRFVRNQVLMQYRKWIQP